MSRLVQVALGVGAGAGSMMVGQAEDELGRWLSWSKVPIASLTVWGSRAMRGRDLIRDMLRAVG